MLAPLNVHSREIGEFDFRNPKMSQHLWFYEGVTEYLSQLIAAQSGQVSPDDFRRKMREKIVGAGRYPAVSFTEMSSKILDSPYKEMYPNVYEKGALIALLLDIRIRELSQGRQTLRDVVLKLRDKYGPTRSFEDAQFIPEIVALTHPDVQPFFDQYVVGSQPLPYAEYFSKIGWQYLPQDAEVKRGFGKLGIQYNPEKAQFMAMGTKPELNAFGLQSGDAILAVNGTTVDPTNAQSLLGPLASAPTGAVTLRVQPVGATTPQERKGVPRDFRIESKHVLRPVENPTPAQLTLRDQLLQPKG
jgi:predicted metalloprotease with PDZ domain